MYTVYINKRYHKQSHSKTGSRGEKIEPLATPTSSGSLPAVPSATTAVRYIVAFDICKGDFCDHIRGIFKLMLQ